MKKLYTVFFLLLIMPLSINGLFAQKTPLILRYDAPATVWTGKVTGLKARGGFTIDMEWANGQLTKATVYSVLGGNCRIRTNEKKTINTPFETAKGESPNRLFNVTDAGKPLIKDTSKLMEMPVNQGFVIDFKTKKGGIYIIQ